LPSSVPRLECRWIKGDPDPTLLIIVYDVLEQSRFSFSVHLYLGVVIWLCEPSTRFFVSEAFSIWTRIIRRLSRWCK
jgi:hypothetical protein